jgi:hypothetical protein
VLSGIYTRLKIDVPCRMDACLGSGLTLTMKSELEAQCEASSADTIMQFSTFFRATT